MIPLPVNYSMKVTRKIPSISMHLRLDDSESTAAAESAHAGVMTRPRSSSGEGGGRTRGTGSRKRAKSSSGGAPLTEGAEGGTTGRLSDLKLETEDSASSKKPCDSKGRGKWVEGVRTVNKCKIVHQ